MSAVVDFLVIAPLDEERAAVLAHLPEATRLPPDDKDVRVYHRVMLPVELPGGEHGTYELVITSPLNMGRVEAATLVADAVRRFSPRFILLVGIGGGDPAAVRLGDVLIGEQFADYEVQKVTDEGAEPRYQAYRASPRLLAAAQHVSNWESDVRQPRPFERSSGQPRVHFGVMMTGDKVQAKSKALQQFKSTWPKLIGVEMEAGGVAAAAWVAAGQPGVLMIRGVSDLADAKKGSRRVARWRGYACDVAAAFAVALLRSGPVSFSPGRSHSRPVPIPNGVHADLLDGMRDDPASGRLQNLMQYYLGAEGGPQPFGGRDAQLRVLQEWLEDVEAPQRLLLLAPAAYGKTALLCHFCVQTARHPNWSIVFFPISYRFDLRRPADVFPPLISRLARICSEAGSTLRSAGLSDWQHQLHERLRDSRLEGRNILVVLDGLDEADGFTLDRNTLPLDLPKGVRLLVAARFLAGDAGDSGWRRRLAWESPKLARTLVLGALDEAAVRDATRTLGLPLGNNAQSSAVVAELMRLSQGNPLVLRLRVESICQTLRPGELPELAVLRKMPPGLDGYLEDLCGPLDETPGSEAADVFLSLLALAKAPLQRSDLSDLAPELSDAAVWKKTLTKLSRIVLGDGQELGFVLSHPCLKDYFTDRMAAPKAGLYRERFLAYGRRSWQHLLAGQVAPQQVSAYLLACFVAHLREAEADPSEFIALVSEPWLQAWHAREQGYVGFLRDAALIREIAETADRQRISKGLCPVHVVGIVRALLFAYSVSDMSAHLYPELLTALLKEGLWSPQRALAAIRYHAPNNLSPSFEELLGAVADYLPKEYIREAASLAVERARIPNSYDRSLLRIAPQLGRTFPDEALRLAYDLPPEWLQFEYLVALLPHLEATRSQAALDWAISITRQQSPNGHANGMLAVANKLGPDSPTRKSHYDEAWDQVLKLAEGEKQLNLMVYLITGGPADLAHVRLMDILPTFLEKLEPVNLVTIVEAIFDWKGAVRARFTTRLVEHARGRDALLRWAAALHKPAVLGEPPPRPGARLEQIRNSLSRDHYQGLMQTAGSWIREHANASHIVQVVEAIASELSGPVIAELSDVFDRLAGSFDRSAALCILASYSDDNARLSAFRTALKFHMKGGGEQLIIYAVRNLLERQVEEAQADANEAFTATREVDQKARRACIQAWLALSDRDTPSSKDLRLRAHREAAHLLDPSAKAEISLGLAARSSAADQQPLLKESFEYLDRITNSESKYITTLKIALSLSQPWQELALGAALEVLSELPLRDQLYKLKHLIDNFTLSDSLRSKVEDSIQALGDAANDGTFVWYNYLEIAQRAQGIKRRKSLERAVARAQRADDLSMELTLLSSVPQDGESIGIALALIDRTSQARDRIRQLVGFLPEGQSPDANERILHRLKHELSLLNHEDRFDLERLAACVGQAPDTWQPMLAGCLWRLLRMFMIENKEFLNYPPGQLPDYLGNRHDSISGLLRTVLPVMLPRLTSDDVTELISWIPRRVEYSDLLARLLPFLTTDCVHQEFEAAWQRALGAGTMTRALRLAELAKVAPPERRSESIRAALEAACKIPMNGASTDTRPNVLADLAEQFGAEHVELILRSLTDLITEAGSQTAYIGRRIPHFVPLMQPEVRERVAYHLLDGGLYLSRSERTHLLLRLAKKDPRYLSRGMQAVRDALDMNTAAALAALGPDLSDADLDTTFELLLTSPGVNQTPSHWTSSLNSIVAECVRRGRSIKPGRLAPLVMDMLTAPQQGRAALLSSLAALPDTLSALGVNLTSLVRAVLNVTESFDRVSNSQVVTT